MGRPFYHMIASRLYTISLLCVFFSTAFSLNFYLDPNMGEQFQENLKAGTSFRGEYNVETGEKILFNIIDNKGRIINEYNSSFNVFHLHADEDIMINMTFKNLNNNKVYVKFNVPDLDNEGVDPEAADATNVQMIHELEQRLKAIIVKVTDYSERMTLFSDKMASYKWKIRMFMALELIFCGSMI